MPHYGKYNPENPENSAILFTFQEGPVTSSKVNRWNGNIDVSFQLLHAVCSALFAQNQDGVLTLGAGLELSALPTDPASMSVVAQPGWALIGGAFAGIAEAITLPAGGTFQAPAQHPRIDSIVLKNTGELTVIEGVEDPQPTAPQTPAGSITLADVFLRVDATQILAGDDGAQCHLIDRRNAFLLGEAHKHSSDHSPEETPDGARDAFTTRHNYREGTLSVFLNGVLQEPGIDYNDEPDRGGYRFVSAPLSGFRIQHRYAIERETD